MWTLVRLGTNQSWKGKCSGPAKLPTDLNFEQKRFRFYRSADKSLKQVS